MASTIGVSVRTGTIIHTEDDNLEGKNGIPIDTELLVMVGCKEFIKLDAHRAQIKTMLGFAEAQCNNEETASSDGCKDLLKEEIFATERK